MRLFIAIALPVDIRARLASLQSGLAGARWIDSDSLHLTLRFLGEVSGHDADDLDTELGRIDFPAFDMALSSVGHFGKRDLVHTLFAGVERNEALNRLQAKVESAAVRTGHEPESRKFHAHVTLARLKDTPLSRVRQWLEMAGSFATEPFPVDRVTLFRSHLGHGGARYEAVAEYPLEHIGV